MMGALVFYVIAVEVLTRVMGLEVRLDGIPTTVRYGLFAVAVTMVFLTQVVRGMLTRKSSPDEVAFASRMIVVSVVTGALSEIPAILGLVTFFVWHEATDFYLMTAISAYLFLRHYPRWSTWEKLAGHRIATSG